MNVKVWLIEHNCRMAQLPFATENFVGSVPPASGNLPVSLARLIWGAITVGATPISLGAPPRPLVELCWRAALAMASIEEDSSSNRWIKTDAYWRLDPSEKSAVSYFLGMTQAKITSEMLLGVPHLVHLDAILALRGRSTNQSRPDFVGMDLASMTYTIGLEAKGRTHDRTDDVRLRAKEQASLLPNIIGTTSNLRVASIAYFGDSYHWGAYLEDPVGPYEELEPMTPGTLMIAYYRPLVSALITAGIEESQSDEIMVFARVPEVDLTLGLPRRVVSALTAVPLAGRLSQDQIEAAGSELLDAIGGLPGKDLASQAGESWASRGALEERQPASCTGLDEVRVQLGPSWFSDT